MEGVGETWNWLFTVVFSCVPDIYSVCVVIGSKVNQWLGKLLTGPTINTFQVIRRGPECVNGAKMCVYKTKTSSLPLQSCYAVFALVMNRSRLMGFEISFLISRVVFFDLCSAISRLSRKRKSNSTQSPFLDKMIRGFDDACKILLLQKRDKFHYIQYKKSMSKPTCRVIPN